MYFLQWKSSNTTGSINFQNCSSIVKTDAETKYLETSGSKFFNFEQLNNYWSMLEKKFDCTGFCKTEYINTETNLKMKMYKYMFSDINK
jgi:hypothetical protein